MNKSLLIICLAAMPFMAGARHLTPQEALSRATSPQGAKVPAKAMYDADAPVTVIDADGESRLYGFNAKGGNGYLILSADDCAVPILGYSDYGSLDPADMSPVMAWWLDEYARQIAYAAANGGFAPYRAPKREANITPMVSARWNQGSPYNDMCPLINGQHAVTGCVATALAQVMYYHKWPEHGTGEYSYDHKSLGTISLDYSAITYDWDAMTPTYGSNSTAASKQAVAKLMYSCGVGVQMDYGLDGSGAADLYIPRVLVENFGYDLGVQRLMRSYFTNAEWEDLIYSELIAGRPVLYGGQSGSGGHEFVCDGYSDGYYHINWGWGGMSDGYFLLTALDPDSQGIGGSTSGYNSDQDAVIGIQRPKAGSTRHLVFDTAGNLSPASYSYSRNANNTLYTIKNDNSQSAFFNQNPFKVTINYGVKLTDAAGDVRYVKSASQSTLNPLYGSYAITVSYNGVPNGNYIVTPAVYDVAYDQWNDIYCTDEQPKTLTLSLTDTQATYTVASGVDHTITVTDFALVTDVYQNTPFKAKATFTSPTDQTVSLCMALFEPGATTPKIWGASTLVVLEAGVPQQVEYVSRLSSYYSMPEVGQTYEMQFVEAYPSFSPVGPRVSVVYQEQPAAPTISFDKLELVNGSSAPANDIRLRGTVSCASGYFASTLPIYLFPGGGGQSLTSYSTPTLFVKAGESADFEFSVQYTSGTVGSVYQLIPAIGNTLIYSCRVYFTLEAPEVPTVETNVITVDYANAFSGATPTNTIAKDGEGCWRANTVAIKDAIKWYSPMDFDAATVTYTRTFSHTNWAALYLPFGMESAEWTSYASQVLEYKGDETIDGEKALVFNILSATDALEANHPYLMRPVSTGEQVLTLTDKVIKATPETDGCINPEGADYALYGIYETKNDMATSGAYALKGGVFYPAADNSVVLKPFRVYVAPNPTAYSMPLRMAIQIDSTTGIADIEATDADTTVIYDLSGRRVERVTPGIYIMNGRKVHIK